MNIVHGRNIRNSRQEYRFCCLECEQKHNAPCQFPTQSSQYSIDLSFSHSHTIFFCVFSLEASKKRERKSSKPNMIQVLEDVLK